MEANEKKLREDALFYHSYPTSGKISITPTKPLSNQRDLSLAYSPGVASACLEIVKDPNKASIYTSRSNLVAVITNGTAVLGLGDIGPLASKPVMEGKSVLFKKFGGIDSIDIEINEKNVDKLIDIIASLEPSFGGINLEDIKSPECFKLEDKLKERMKIPVFHDDQHGTSIIVAAALINALKLVRKKISKIKIVCSGAGAAAMACLDLIVFLGAKRSNIFVFDNTGLVYTGRGKLDDKKKMYCQDASVAKKGKKLGDHIKSSDVFIGLSVADVVSGEEIAKMSKNPVIFALSNPNPEIKPELIHKVRDDAIVATGRSDYPNQVNNVLCFPFLFRGALDVGATCINEEMKKAAVYAIAELAQAEGADSLEKAYGGEDFTFSKNYIIPKPFDHRLILRIAPAVAKAAMDSRVANLPITDFKAYQEKLSYYIYRSGLIMKPMFDKAKQVAKRIVLAEGEEETTIRALQIIIDDNLSKYPVLIGRRRVVETRVKKFAPRIKIDKDFELVDPEQDSRYREYWQLHYKIMSRHGVTPDLAKRIVRTSNTAIASLMVRRGEADAMVCGVIGKFLDHYKTLEHIIEKDEKSPFISSMMLLVTDKGPIFITDTHIRDTHNGEDVSNLAKLACDEIELFGIQPKVAFLSNSNFGNIANESSRKMAEGAKIFKQKNPHIQSDGEMHTDTALMESVRNRIMPDSTLIENANLLVMPSLESANIVYNSIKAIASAQAVGPILLGSKRSAFIVTTSVTSRGLVNVATLACVTSSIIQNSTKHIKK